MTKARLGWLLAGWTLLASPALADASLPARIDAFLLDRYKTFSGAILVTQDGGIVFDKAYGFADAAHQVSNRTTTSFHIGALSAQYTAAAMMMLVDKGRVTLDNTAGQFVPGTPDADKSIRDLLGGNPRLAATPAGYVLLGRILETNTAKPLAEVLDTDFFGPLFMHGSGLDDGTLSAERRMALGYVPGDAMNPAPAADWAKMMGEGSAYTTTRDELRWVDAFFSDGIVSAATRQRMLDPSGKYPGGYGWNLVQGFPEPAYGMAGTATGFAAAVIHVPGHNVTVVVLANTESELLVAHIGLGLTALALGREPAAAEPGR
jgi:D-alanyl-D-alanine carboxypeptidase